MTADANAGEREVRDFLARLSEASGVAGHEEAIAALVEEAFRPYADEVRRDRLGNVIALRRGAGPEPRPKVMWAAHMDEIGMMVSKIEPGGFLRFAPVGGVDRKTTLGQEVRVHGRRPLRGIVGVRPPHLLGPGEREKHIPLDEQFIDVGLPEARVRELVRPGDLITVERRCLDLLGGLLAGKAFDDRAGVAAMFQGLRYLAGIRHAADVYAVATVQEEVGLRGAMTSTFHVMPDVGIAIDVGFGDMPGQDETVTIEVEKGPALTVGPNIHPLLHRLLVSICKEHRIPYQVEVAPGNTGTDAWAMQVTRSGVATALLSLPLRYMHTSVEVVSLQDVRSAGRLLALAAAAIDPGFVAALAAAAGAAEARNGAEERAARAGAGEAGR